MPSQLLIIDVTGATQIQLDNVVLPTLKDMSSTTAFSDNWKEFSSNKKTEPSMLFKIVVAVKTVQEADAILAHTKNLDTLVLGENVTAEAKKEAFLSLCRQHASPPKDVHFFSNDPSHISMAEAQGYHTATISNAEGLVKSCQALEKSFSNFLVRLMTGPLYSLNMRVSDTVGDIKTFLSSHLGNIPVEQQRLVLGHNELTNDNETIGELTDRLHRHSGMIHLVQIIPQAIAEANAAVKPVEIPHTQRPFASTSDDSSTAPTSKPGPKS